MTLQDPDRQPLVSVIIPAYNYGHFVLSAIESVRLQDYPHIEIIVIDDGSTDNTPQILARLPDIIYVRQENKGLSAARNHGIRLAKGKYLQFLDADDLLGPTSVRKRVDILEKNPGSSAVICRSAIFHEQVYPEKLAFLHREWRQPEMGYVDLALYRANIAPPHAFLVRKSVVDTHNIEFDPHLRACEDYDFWFRLALVSNVPCMLRSCWVYYRRHANSMSRSCVNQYRHDAELCKRIRATATGAIRWLGNRPPADYLAGMFAASVLTARHLWQVDRALFTDFLSSHVLPLQQQVEAAKQNAPTTAAAAWYLAKTRHMLLIMWLHDRSLSQTLYEQLHRPIPFSCSFFLSTFGRVGREVSVRTLTRLLKLDLLHVALLLFFRRRRSGLISGMC